MLTDQLHNLDGDGLCKECGELMRQLLPQCPTCDDNPRVLNYFDAYRVWEGIGFTDWGAWDVSMELVHDHLHGLVAPFLDFWCQRPEPLANDRELQHVWKQWWLLAHGDPSLMPPPLSNEEAVKIRSDLAAALIADCELFRQPQQLSQCPRCAYSASELSAEDLSKVLDGGTLPPWKRETESEEVTKRRDAFISDAIAALFFHGQPAG